LPLQRNFISSATREPRRTVSKSTEERRVVETTAEPNEQRLPLFARRTQQIRLRTGVKAGSCTAEESGG
jgi:hypothetical protein